VRFPGGSLESGLTEIPDKPVSRPTIEQLLAGPLATEDDEWLDGLSGQQPTRSKFTTFPNNYHFS
jgi:hypothetical protein